MEEIYYFGIGVINMIPPTIYISGITLADAWAKAVKEVMKNGLILPSEYGPRTKDVCSMMVIKYPFAEPMLHPDFPTKEQHLREYVKQFTREYDWETQGFKYTYIDRLVNYPIDNPYSQERGEVLDQFEHMRTNLNKPVSRRVQAITWVPAIDVTDDEPPCLQRIWMRKLTPSTVEMHCDWRSRDLFSAWNSNYIGILSMIDREILKPLNLKLVKLVDFVDALHIYEGNWEEAALVRPVIVNPMLYR